MAGAAGPHPLQCGGSPGIPPASPHTALFLVPARFPLLLPAAHTCDTGGGQNVRVVLEEGGGERRFELRKEFGLLCTCRDADKVSAELSEEYKVENSVLTVKRSVLLLGCSKGRAQGVP